MRNNKKSFCVYYGQSNYPKVIFTKNLGAIKEHFSNFCCFQKKFSDARHTLVVSPPPSPCERKVTYTQRAHFRMNDFIAVTAVRSLFFFARGKIEACDTAHSFLSPAVPQTCDTAHSFLSPAVHQTKFPTNLSLKFSYMCHNGHN